MTNEEQILEMLKQNQDLLEKTHASAEKTRKYFLYSIIFTVVAFLLPILALAFILPAFITSYTESMSTTGLL